MPDPRKLKVGDRVRFVSIPDEWSLPNYTVPKEDRAFMQAMIKRRFPSRIRKIDECGIPWIYAWLKVGKATWHGWGISETTGWRLVKKRAP